MIENRADIVVELVNNREEFSSEVAEVSTGN